jgi:hypothetical protein
MIGGRGREGKKKRLNNKTKMNVYISLSTPGMHMRKKEVRLHSCFASATIRTVITWMKCSGWDGPFFSPFL